MNEIQEIQKYYDQLKDKIKISWRLNEKNTFKFNNNNNLLPDILYFYSNISNDIFRNAQN